MIELDPLRRKWQTIQL